MSSCFYRYLDFKFLCIPTGKARFMRRDFGYKIKNCIMNSIKKCINCRVYLESCKCRNPIVGREIVPNTLIVCLMKIKIIICDLRQLKRKGIIERIRKSRMLGISWNSRFKSRINGQTVLVTKNYVK
jgi:hypothetical protein